MGERELSNTLRALARMGLQPIPELLDVWQAHALAAAEKFSPKGVGDALWALAMLRIAPEPPLLAALEHQVGFSLGLKLGFPCNQGFPSEAQKMPEKPRITF